MMILEDQIIIEAKEQIEAGIPITPLWESTGFIRDLSQRVFDILLDTLEVCFQGFGIHTAYLIRREIPKATKAGSRNVAATPVSVPPHAAATQQQAGGVGNFSQLLQQQPQQQQPVQQLQQQYLSNQNSTNMNQQIQQQQPVRGFPTGYAPGPFPSERDVVLARMAAIERVRLEEEFQQHHQQQHQHYFPTPPSRLMSGGTSKRVRRKCTVVGCSNRVVQGGLCIAHGAKRKLCKHPGCKKHVKKAGLCSTHGPARKRCEVENCTKVAVQGGRCIAHGAKKKLCCVDQCTKQAILGGMCKKHHDQKVAGEEPVSCTIIPRKNRSSKPTKKPGHTRGLSIFQEISVDAVGDLLAPDGVKERNISQGASDPSSSRKTHRSTVSRKF